MGNNISGIGGRSPFKHIWLFAFLFFLFMNFALMAFVLSVSQKFNTVNKEKTYLLEQIDLSREILGNIDKMVITNEQFAEKTIKEQVEAKEVFQMEKSFWSYEISVNGSKVTANEISVNAGKVTIMLKENEKERVLPLTMHNMGSITGGDKRDNYYDHVMFQDKSKININHTGDNTLNRTATYELNIGSGQEVKVSLTEILAERLGLLNKVITIKAR